MAKKKKSTKKSLLIASLALIVVFALSLVVMAVVPYSATSYTNTSTNDTLKTTTTTRYYVSKDKVKIKSVTKREDGDKSTSEHTYSSYVEDGKFYQYLTEFGEAMGTPAINGDIDAYKLVIGDVVYTNTFATAMMIVSIVGVSLGGVGLVLYFVLGNKKTSKKKK